MNKYTSKEKTYPSAANGQDVDAALILQDPQHPLPAKLLSVIVIRL
jgi:hypothetical protein